jgi:hypothetical protein
MGLDNFSEFGCYFIQSLIPGDAFKSISNMLKRKSQSLRVILKVRDIRALPANIPLRTRIFLVTSDLHDLVAFCDDLQATVLATQYTGSFLPFVHISSISENLFIC